MIDLNALASDRYRITLDPSAQFEPRVERPWFYRIPCKYGFIGVHGENTLLAYCRANRVLPRLLALEGVVLKQRGDKEANLTLPPSQLDAVAEILQAKRRIVLSPEEKTRRAEMTRQFNLAKGKNVEPDAPQDAPDAPDGGR